MSLSTQPLQLLQQLVQFATVTGDFSVCEEALDAIQAFLAERGMHIYRNKHDEFGVLVATTQPTKEPAVMFVGHLDVVPAEDGLFTVREAGNRLYGRGTYDMKGALANYLLLVDTLQEDLASYDFGIMLVTDEETIDQSLGRLLNEDGFRPKSAVLFDGGRDWQLEVLAKGTWFGTVTVSGAIAHGSRPWEGDSASFKLLALLEEIKQLFPDPGLETNTLNISALEAGKIGEATNQIPGKAVAALDVRCVSAEENKRVHSAITGICQRYDATLEKIASFPVIKHDLASLHLREFAASIQKVTGIENKGTISCGASDAVHFHALGIPCAVTFPLGSGHHSAEEWLGKQAYLDLLPILLDYTQKMARTAQTDLVPSVVAAR